MPTLLETPRHSRPRRPSTRELQRRILCEAVTIVRAEFSRPLTVDELARRTATSPRQLHRAFSEVGGTGFRAYLAKVRMRHAAELLRSSDLTISEVGRRVGYREPSQFTKAFKRAHGVTPKEFRGPR
jgi:AraC family transcriptional regulator, regulatory protein of adaptative response / methylphosphotriester-DNA alkyltransferase methyltransferase